MSGSTARSDLVRSVLVVVLGTIVLGLAYPALMVGISQLAFSNQANGSLITDHGRTVGSKLAAQAFTVAGLLPPPPVRHRPGL